ncbi:MAG: hypothetical protein IJ873_04500 [Lachnospiraceae bacterium]|nr:hypothetical protein [Lachnospiraceae bacterium]MBR2275308.1 hypothetical protein [Lachnospiraceae bacterium]
MINFEEELKKFRPSMEIDQVEDVVYNQPLTDMTDIMLEMMKREKEAVDNATVAVAAEIMGQPIG